MSNDIHPFYCVYQAEEAVIDMQTQPRQSLPVRSNTHRPFSSRKLRIFPDMIHLHSCPLPSQTVCLILTTLFPSSAYPMRLRRVPQPRHLQPRPHHRPRQRADTLPPAVHEPEREMFDGGFHGYDIYVAFSLCVGRCVFTVFRVSGWNG